MNVFLIGVLFLTCCTNLSAQTIGASNTPTTLRLLKELVADGPVIHQKFLSHHVTLSSGPTGYLVEFETGPTFHIDQSGLVQELHSGKLPHWVKASEDDYALLWSVFAIMRGKAQPTYPLGTILPNDEHLPNPLSEEEMDLVRGECTCPGGK